MHYLKVLLTSVVLSFVCIVWPVNAETNIPASADFSAGDIAGGVNINTADADMLAATLKGVGEKRAQAIITYRKNNGPFSDVSQLENIKGISAAIINKNIDRIRF